MSAIVDVFKKLSDRQDTIIFDGADIIAQIPQHIRQESFLDRPADVRLLMITENLGKRAGFSNPGQPDNDPSLVDFNGENGIMIMPAGIGPAEQIANARELIEVMRGRRMTPELILAFITPKGAPYRHTVKEMYGPVSGREGVDAQVSRFVASEIVKPDGTKEIITPDVQDNYAMGLRAPTREEVYKVQFQTLLPATIIGSEYKTDIDFWDMNNAMKGREIYLRGTETAPEKLDPLVIVQDEIYLAVDAAGGLAKPIKKSVAEAIFDVKKATSLIVDQDGALLSVTLPIQARKNDVEPKAKPVAGAKPETP